MQVFVIFIIMISCRPTPAAHETSTQKAHKFTHKCLHLAAFAQHSKSWTWTVRDSECPLSTVQVLTVHAAKQGGAMGHVHVLTKYDAPTFEPTVAKLG